MKYIITLLLTLIFSCQANKSNSSWSKDAIMYEVNIRQFTPEGTFKAFAKHLPRIKDLGIDIIWFMPIHPIGEKNRKGTLGSYYSVKDFQAINPEFGSMEDFKELVDEIHRLDMKVIIDWVANHTAFDNIWIENGKLDWYTLDSLGNLQPPLGTDWWDVADLNYDNLEMRQEMIKSMKFWLKETNIDGFRCDVADWVPIDFWKECIEELKKEKSVFMLAEAENPELHRVGFDATYAWHFHFVMNEIAQNKKFANDIKKYIKNKSKEFSKSSYRLHFTSNHDENSWKGHVNERLGSLVKSFAVMSVTLEGMPLIYNGQEAGLNKRLEFFEKDTICWDDLSMTDFYKKLFKLKKENIALWNGDYGGEIEIVSNEGDSLSFAYIRKKNNNKVISIFNFSEEERFINLSSEHLKGEFSSIFNRENIVFSTNEKILLKPWQFKVYVNK